MTAPNRATLWGRVVVDELAKAGVEAVVVAPGSRSTPLAVAADAHEDLSVFSQLDERSAAFFALGRAKRTGEPTPLVCTSGTATANVHPAVMEADQARVPLLVLTADRPAELQDSGANQTTDQTKLYGDAPRLFRTLPEPDPRSRALRSVRTTVARALATAAGTGNPPGPVHLNCPFRKPLEPTEVAPDGPDGVPPNLAERAPVAVEGRDGPFVDVHPGAPAPDADTVDSLADALANADRPLLVAGPTDAAGADPADATAAPAVAELADALGAPLLADPLSGLRFGSHVEALAAPVLGGYDAYLDERVTREWPDPDVVIRFGASPTSKPLRRYLRDADCRQYVVDPAGGWREATFTATDLVVADPSRLAGALAERLDRDAVPAWHDRFVTAERTHWELLSAAGSFFEGQVLADAFEMAPDPATLFLSNSMPVRDADRFACPTGADLTVLGNRGVSGIDGVTSTALGAGSATDDPLVLVTGDLAYYHDMNGLLALARCGIDATIVVINNDGGGIFHMLPIESFDPPFTGQFKTPHGLEFSPTEDLYDLEFAGVRERADFRERYRESVGAPGTRVIEVVSDAEASHRTREALQGDLVDALATR